MSQEQKALVLSAPSSPYAVISKPIPVPGDDEILVRLQGIALNPIEAFLPIFPPLLEGLTYPVYTGCDGAGVVEEVGKDVDAAELKKGDRVVFRGWMSADYSTYQQYALAPAKLVAKIPSTTSTLEASSIPLGLATAAFAFCLPDPAVLSPTKMVGDYRNPLFFGNRSGAGLKPFWEEGAKGLKEGEPIIILGGSSSVGQFAIQIASHYGFSPIITTSSSKHSEYLKALGATYVLDRDAPIDSIKEILRTTIPIEYVFVAVPNALTESHVDLLSAGGTVISVIPTELKDKHGDGTGIRFTNASGSVHGYKGLGYGLFGALEGLLAREIIKPNRIEKLLGGLGGITDGLERMKKGEVSGVKLVVDPTETV